MKSFLAIFSVIYLLATPALADDVTEVVEEAMQAYADGDIKGAMSDLEFAIELLNQMASAGLEQYLPEAQDGWTMEIDRESGAAMAMMGGGTFAGGIYSNDDGEEFTIQILAGGPLVASMGAMFGLAAQGRLVRIQREKFSIGDDEITGMVGDNVMIKVEGYEVDEAIMLAHLETMDMKALADF